MSPPVACRNGVPQKGKREKKTRQGGRGVRVCRKSRVSRVGLRFRKGAGRDARSCFCNRLRLLTRYDAKTAARLVEGWRRAPRGGDGVLLERRPYNDACLLIYPRTGTGGREGLCRGEQVLRGPRKETMMRGGRRGSLQDWHGVRNKKCDDAGKLDRSTAPGKRSGAGFSMYSTFAGLHRRSKYPACC